MYDHLRCFCTFIGNTRSGHSLVGALIDAHPNALIAHEIDVFGPSPENRRAGRLAAVDRIELFDTLVRASEEQARRGRRAARRGRDGARYSVSYAVPGQFQGSFTELHVVGNKRGQRTAEAIEANADSLRLLSDQVALELRLVHVVRNPFDNIASMNPGDESRRRFRRMLDRYFRRSEAVARAKAEEWPVLDVFLEELIEEPTRELARVCEFLSLEPGADYLEACAPVVLAEPSEPRLARRWTKGELKAIERRIGDYPWLEPYRATGEDLRESAVRSLLR
jgi:hypothetical protein